jgi:hypothetical protein
MKRKQKYNIRVNKLEEVIFQNFSKKFGIPIPVLARNLILQEANKIDLNSQKN